MEYPFLKNIIVNFSTPLKNNSRVEQIILALLSAPKITPFFKVTGMFLYNNSIYKQVSGVTMGCPLDPSIANSFLGHLEQYNIFNKSNINPRLYVRYVDDIFAVFDKNVNFQLYLDHIDHQHSNIKFAVEESVNNVLAFLDTSIRIKGKNLESFVYRKSTNTKFCH